MDRGKRDYGIGKSCLMCLRRRALDREYVKEVLGLCLVS